VGNILTMRWTNSKGAALNEAAPYILFALN